jgi:hypothetical protein
MCRGDLKEVISAYADDELPAGSAKALAAHLADCSSCTSLYERHLQTRRLLTLSEADSWTPPDLRLRIVHAVGRPPVRRRRMPWPAGILASAAMTVLVAVLALGIGPTGFTASPATTPSPEATVAPTTQSARLASCADLSGRALADCLGISFHWLPTVLADQRYSRAVTATVPISAARRSPLPVERHAQTRADAGVIAPGAGSGAMTKRKPNGLIPM